MKYDGVSLTNPMRHFGAAFRAIKIAALPEPAVARKSRQIGLCKRLNGNKKVRTVAETLSYTWSPSAANSLRSSEGVPFDVFEGHFFDPVVFSRKAEFRVFGAIWRALRPRPTSCPR